MEDVLTGQESAGEQPDATAAPAEAPETTPEPATAPAAEAAPETPAAPPVPEWVSDFRSLTTPQVPQVPQGPTPQPGAPPATPYPGAPTAPPQPPQGSGVDLEALIQNPEAVIAAAAEAKVAPLQEAVQTMASIMEMQIKANADAEMARVQETVKAAYRDVFAKDRYYTGDEGVRNRVDNMLRNVVQQAHQAATYGDFTKLRQLQDNRTMQAIVAFARIAEGKALDSGATAAMQPGTTVEGVQTQPGQGPPNVTQDEREACKAAGISVEEYVKARDEADKYNSVY